MMHTFLSACFMPCVETFLSKKLKGRSALGSNPLKKRNFIFNYFTMLCGILYQEREKTNPLFFFSFFFNLFSSLFSTFCKLFQLFFNLCLTFSFGFSPTFLANVFFPTFPQLSFFNFFQFFP